MRRILPTLLFLSTLAGPAFGQVVPPSRINSSKLVKTLSASSALPSWTTTYFEQFDAAAAALDLQPLRDVRLARDEREVRVWTQVETGVPKRMARVREVGGRISGDGVMYWPVDKPDTSRREKAGEAQHDIVAYNLAGTCGPIRVRNQMAACRTRYVRSPDWRAILTEADSAGMWTIPDPESLPSDGIMTIDGWTIVVELRTSDSYRVYRYNSPEAHPKWPSAAQAIKIAVTFARADELLMPPDAQKRYRGVTSGKYRTAIKLCGGDTRWEFADDLSSAAKRAGVAMPDSAGHSTAEYYVDVTGIASPEWAAKQGESEFPRVLAVGQVHVVKPWTGAECAK